MKLTRLEQMQNQIAAHFDEEQGIRITRYMQNEYDKLCSEFANQHKAMEPHTHKNIFPVVTAFRALLAEGMERKEAAELVQSCFLKLMGEPAESIRKIMKFPGLYRLMPRLWKTFTTKLFREDAGFRFNFYPSDSKRVKFDMLACPYLKACEQLDCLELAPAFCMSDDICYGNMHPNLIWNRTKTLAINGEPCDFDLYIKK